MEVAGAVGRSRASGDYLVSIIPTERPRLVKNKK